MNLLVILSAFIAGVALAAQSMINGTLAKKTGMFESAFLTVVSGSIFLGIMIVFFAEGEILKIADVPKWQLLCAFFGLAYVVLMVVAVPKIGVTASVITVIIGQIVSSMIIDHYGWFGNNIIPLDLERVVGILLMFVALYFIVKGNQKSESENKHVHTIT
ncbi:DMT family transporter [Melghirimyces algeriensis]|uniref:Transporter family-2 protein n=1 Tax=Melghirimyces algeriensis TaxID=910412 RepID=A0A521FHI6_9BACL|nr:DMT family transporter [Melghirimyces algeriensis]SMO95663.1 transporter family-2 protein [Melghirimyces algeriensis]